LDDLRELTETGVVTTKGHSRFRVQRGKTASQTKAGEVARTEAEIRERTWQIPEDESLKPNHNKYPKVLGFLRQLADKEMNKGFQKKEDVEPT